MNTTSAWYFVPEVVAGIDTLNFSEGGPELNASITRGAYTPTEYAAQIQIALNAAGALDYTVTFNRAERTLTVAASGTFELLVSSGSSGTDQAYATMGFSGADRTGAATYTGNLQTGNGYYTQFPLQSFVAFEDDQTANQESVNTSTDGTLVEVVSFGLVQRMRCNIKYVTDIEQPCGGVISNNSAGKSDLRTFLLFGIEKKPMEFMFDITTPSVFTKCILDSTPESGNGTGFRIKEQFSDRIGQYFSSGQLVFRKVT